MNYANLMTNELVREAEARDNELALVLFERAEDEARERLEEDECPENSDFPDMDGDEIFEVMKILMNPEWNKVADGRYILNEFDGNFNVYHNHIEVSRVSGRNYDITIDYAALGESRVGWSRIEGLKAAKELAIHEAMKLVCNGELNC